MYGIKKYYILLVIILFASSKLYAQRRGGLEYTTSFDFGLTPNSVVINEVETGKSIKISSPSFNYKAKGGIMFADFNYIYGYIEIRNGGSSSISSLEFADTVVDRFNHDISGIGGGIGYMGYIGEQNTNSINYYGGLDIGLVSISNKYRGGTTIDDSSNSTSFTPISIFGGVNYRTRSTDFHSHLVYYVSGEGSADELTGVETTNSYTETVDISGIGIVVGINQYF